MVATSNALKIKSASTTAAASGDKRLKGVRMRSWGKWVSEIRLPNSRARLWLGSYATAEQAARAFDVALVCLRGTSAVLNFPQSPPIFAPLGLPHHQIQELAAAAAVAHASPSPSIANCCPSPETSSILDELDATAATSSYTNIGCSQSPLSSTSLNDDSVAFEELGVLDHENRPSALMRSSFCVDAVIHDEFQLIDACTWDEPLWANSTLDSNWISVCAPRLPVNDDDDFAAPMADPHCLWSL